MPGTRIRAVKNLHVCEDCNFVTNLISCVYKKKIVGGDCIRYHHFREGNILAWNFGKFTDASRSSVRLASR